MCAHPRTMEFPDFGSVFLPKYIDNCRTCDGPLCESQRKLRGYNTSTGYKLFFCDDYHHNDPFNVDDLHRIHNCKKPVSMDRYYKIVGDTGSLLCGYVGCEEFIDLQKFNNNYYCREHMQIFVNLHLQYIDKKNPHETLIAKLQEFNYRKILSIENLRHIYQLENHLLVDKKLYSQLAINLVHKEYLIRNYDYYEEYKLTHPVVNTPKSTPKRGSGNSSNDETTRSGGSGGGGSPIPSVSSYSYFPVPLAASSPLVPPVPSVPLVYQKPVIIPGTNLMYRPKPMLSKSLPEILPAPEVLYTRGIVGTVGNNGYNDNVRIISKNLTRTENVPLIKPAKANNESSFFVNDPTEFLMNPNYRYMSKYNK